MTGRRRAAAGALAAAAVGAAARKPPHIPGLACPFRQLTGIDCPGCGSTRALIALAHGDVAAAADFNILVLLAVVALAAHAASGWRGPSRTPLLHRRGAAIAAGVLVISFWGLRLTDTGIGHWLASNPT